MNKDARLLLNRKKWNTSQRRGSNQRGPRTNMTDARKILTLKRSKFLRTSTDDSEIFKFEKSFTTYSKVPEKHVQLARDGNIYITSKSENSHEAIKPPDQMQWTPADIDMDNLEHVGIDDLIDMESLPTTVMSSAPYKSRLMSPRSLAQEVHGMQNTMVADQVASTSAYQNTCVIVENLQASVSIQDLLELFGDIGLVKAAEMTGPGTALIKFYSFEDASRACNTYHNRHFDGQPVKCYLQPCSINQHNSVSQRLSERIQTVIPPSYASPLSYNPRSRYNPRDVHFTVKLS